MRRSAVSLVRRFNDEQSSRPSRRRTGWRPFRRPKTAAGFDSARYQLAEAAWIRGRRTDPQARTPRKTSLHEPGVVAGHRPKSVQSGRPWLHSEAPAGTDLLPAIDAVLGGQRFVSRSMAFTEPTDAPAPRRHEILFCSDDAAIVDGLTRYIAAALNAGDAAIVLVTESHRKRLVQELRTQGVDIDGAIERGTYRSFDADEAPEPVRFLEAINGVREAATKAGNAHPRVAFCGERAGRLWAEGRTAEAVQLEQSVANSRMTSIFCACIRCRTRKTIGRSRACARSTPLFLPASRCNVRCV